jgi:hypothetical protein
LLLASLAALATLVVFVWLALAARPADRPTSPPLPSYEAPSSLEPEPSGARVLVGAGDIASCDRDADEATARLVERISGTVFTTGDNVYERGTRAEFERCYDPTWGRFKERTQPVPGNHDYATENGAAYFGYFGRAAGSPSRSWYAYDLGSWRIYALDSNCERIAGGCGEGSTQVAWLRDDLEANSRRCVAAFWHHPRFSSGRHGSTPAVDTLWRVLVAGGAELVVTGHDHLYERFAPLDADGRPDTLAGTRHFTVGTGGRDLYEFRQILDASEVRDAGTFGVLRLDLRADGYDWRFLPVPGAAFTDEGTGGCR